MSPELRAVIQQQRRRGISYVAAGAAMFSLGLVRAVQSGAVWWLAFLGGAVAVVLGVRVVLQARAESLRDEAADDTDEVVDDS